MSRLSDTISSIAAERNLNQAELADMFDMSQQAVSELMRGNTANPRKWRTIAKSLGIPELEMQAMMIEATNEMEDKALIERGVVHIGRALASSPPFPDARILGPISTPGKERMIPVLGEAVGGVDGEYSFNGHILDYVACPPSLANVANAYAVYIDGESMFPRYKSGETVYVHPTKPARRGDDVIIQVRPNSEDVPPFGYVKEFVGWTGSELVLKQYNPASEVRFARDEVVSVHPIILAGKY